MAGIIDSSCCGIDLYEYSLSPFTFLMDTYIIFYLSRQNWSLNNYNASKTGVNVK